MKKTSGYKQYIGPALCVAGGIALYLLLALRGGEDTLAEKGMLSREDYGGSAEEYRITVEGLTDREIPLTVSVKPRIYTEDEAEEIFFDVMDGMEEILPGENPSLQEVRSKLILPSGIAENGVSISWSSSDADVMDDSGKVAPGLAEERDIVLTAVLSAEVAADNGEIKTLREQFEIPIRVLPAEKTAEEAALERFMAEVEDEEEKGRTAAWFKLPSQFEGRSLSYRSEGGTDYRMIVLIGVLLAALMVAHRQNEENEDKKKREKELSLDYSDMLSKFVVLTGAGLTVRNVWERMVHDYEESRSTGGKKRAVYEEMRQTSQQIQNGIPEQEAYRNFGRRCGLSGYLKFSSLLEQNCRSGTKNLREILQTEMNDALEERKNIARRLGEEAGTKLLLPLFLLLGIVMAMIMVPALMMMG